MQSIRFPVQLNFGMGGGGGGLMSAISTGVGGMGGGGEGGGGILDMAMGMIDGGGGSSAPSTSSAPAAPAAQGGGSDVYKSGATGMTGAMEDVGAGAVQMVAGLVQGITGIEQKRKAQTLFPSLIDPLEAKAYSEYKTLERSTQTGLAFANDLGKTLSAQKAVNRGIASRSGGAVGLAVAGMSKTSTMFAKTMNDLIDKTQEQRRFYSSMANAKGERISDRKLDLEMLKYNQAMAEATQNEQEGKSNVMGGTTRSMAGINSGISSIMGG